MLDNFVVADEANGNIISVQNLHNGLCLKRHLDVGRYVLAVGRKLMSPNPFDNANLWWKVAEIEMSKHNVSKDELLQVHAAQPAKETVVTEEIVIV